MRRHRGWVLLLSLMLLPTNALWPCCGASFGPIGAPASASTGCVNSDTKCLSCDRTASPAFMMTGNYQFEQSDLTLGGPGPSISVYRVYNSQDRYVGPVGKGWHHSLILRAVKMTDATQEYVLIRMPSASRVIYTKSGNSYVSPPGHNETLVENQDGTLTLTWTDGTVWKYSADGWIDYIQDLYGNTLTYTYATINGQKRPQTITGAGGRSVTIDWNGAGRIRSITDHTGRVVQYNYDQDKNLESVVDVAGRVWDYTYVLSGPYALLASVEFQALPYASASYDSSNRVIGYMENGETWTIEYQGDRTVKRDASANEWQHFYDSEGRITKSIDPSGGTFEKTFYPDGKVQMTTDQVGVKTYYVYNANGTIASVTKDYQGPLPVRYDYAYDGNFPEKVTRIVPVDPGTGEPNRDWQEVRYDYYQAGEAVPGALHHLYSVRSDGTVDTIATYTYTGAGQLETVADAAGSETRYVYDPSGELSSVVLPANSDSGQTRTYTYQRDQLGRLTSVTDPMSHVTGYTYEALDRIATVTLPKPAPGSPLDFTTRYSYDNLDTGLLYTNQTDPNGRIVKQAFDQFGRLVKTIDALNNATAFTYADGQLVAVADANDNVTTYTYDAAHHLSATTFPEGPSETYTYYADGQLKTKTDRKGQTITYKYDSLKNLIEKTYPNATSIKYIYQGQKLIRVEDGYAAETHTFDYDTAYRVRQETQGPRGTLTYSYDNAGRLAGYAVTGGASTQYSYYPDGSLDTIDWSPIAGQFKYTYTPNGQYNLVTFPNGQYRQYSYDDQGRLLQLANVHPTAGNLATFAYGYDVDNYTSTNAMLGQRTSMTMDFPAANQTNALHKYYYDSNYQLTRVDYPAGAPFNSEVHQWTYDAIGNRLTNTVNDATQTYTYYKNGSNPKNGQRLQSDGVNTYTFDANGSALSRTNASASYNLSWNHDNRLVAIAGSEPAEYGYDYLGRRATKNAGGTSVPYLYVGADLVAQLGVVIGEYVFGPNIDEPLGALIAANPWYFDSDGLGTILAIMDPTGATPNRYVYDAWGRVKDRAASIDNPFGYTSREFDVMAHWFFRNRFYDPAVGRFISSDPWTFRKEWFQYGYAGNSPAQMVDPLGLFTVAKDCSTSGRHDEWLKEAQENFLTQITGNAKCQKILQANQGTGPDGTSDLLSLMRMCFDRGTIHCKCDWSNNSDCGWTPLSSTRTRPSVVLFQGYFTNPNCTQYGKGETLMHECLHTYRFGGQGGRGPVEPNTQSSDPERKLFGDILHECFGRP